MSIRILDCTLRDGGYINDWKFGRDTIVSILDKLDQAHIDIIECGFLTGMVKDAECSLFESAEAIEAVLPKRERNSMYVAMIAIGEKELDPLKLEPYRGTGIEGIRLTFHKKEISQAFSWAQILMEKGYRVFMQPVGTVFYSDMELLQLVERINELSPYAFYIVDTLGSMYRNDVSHRFYVIDKNMKPGIHIGFHGHNNLQLAFSNAQILGKIQTKRTLILDASVYSMAYHIAAVHVCHPNYATYLINRQTLTMQDIEKIIQSIPPKHKVLYDQKLIKQLYDQFQSRQIDDSAAVAEISRLVQGRKIMLLAPGKSLISRYDTILDFMKQAQPYVISVNFVDKQYQMDACFVSSHKRMDVMGQENLGQVRTILTSNIPGGGAGSLYVDYDHYTNDDDMVSDNAGLMLLKLLQRCGAQDVYLAGFDGFHHRHNGNYYSDKLNLKVNEEEVQERRRRIRKQLKALSESMRITFLTPSVYEQDEPHV